LKTRTNYYFKKIPNVETFFPLLSGNKGPNIFEAVARAQAQRKGQEQAKAAEKVPGVDTLVRKVVMALKEDAQKKSPAPAGKKVQKPSPSSPPPVQKVAAKAKDKDSSKKKKQDKPKKSSPPKAKKEHKHEGKHKPGKKR
uniref:H15 domain-containing protein n=1 Tax=Heligmosomoides polygyrus TaxID=6339 RepID=A0A183GX46_HELPZ